MNTIVKRIGLVAVVAAALTLAYVGMASAQYYGPPYYRYAPPSYGYYPPYRPYPAYDPYPGPDYRYTRPVDPWYPTRYMGSGYDPWTGGGNHYYDGGRWRYGLPPARVIDPYGDTHTTFSGKGGGESDKK